MSGRRTIATEDAPAAIGPYSQAVVADGFVFASGQIGLDPRTGGLVGGGAEQEAERALENLRAVLEAAGSGLDAVVRCDVFLTDLGDFEPVNAVYGRFFGAEPPARVTVQVAGLPKGACVEIAAVAAVASGP